MYTKEELKNQLKQMGILPTDTVMIHTSMKAIGQVEGGPDGVLDAFCEYLQDGLFLVPTHTWLEVTPDHPVFDVRSAVPNIGIIPRTAAFRTFLLCSFFYFLAKKADNVKCQSSYHKVFFRVYFCLQEIMRMFAR